MSDAITFHTPANIQDLTGTAQEALNTIWNRNVGAFVQQAAQPDPSFFYDPADTAIPQGTQALQVSWNAFPGRLQQYYSDTPPVSPANPYSLSDDEVNQLADFGKYKDTGGGEVALQDIPAAYCPEADWNGTLQAFGPYGPRGWMDEYCEWSVTRNDSGKVQRVDFCCENPEYIYSLWSVDPGRLREIFEQTLNFDAPEERHISVTMDDLTLKDEHGTAVIDPQTGHPAYNPMNKWNNRPASVRGSDATGGAMHLTSSPNTLQTEIGLAGFATPQFVSGNSNSQSLICCGRFGQAYRHSDPHIGQTANQAVGGQLISGQYFKINLADPFGLYIQEPANLNQWAFGPDVDQNLLPAGAAASDVFQIVRGVQELLDPVAGGGQYFPSNTGGNGNFILHAVCQIPSSWLVEQPDLTLHDILIDGQPVRYGAQIAARIDMALYVRPLATLDVPPENPCVMGGSAQGAPLQMFQTSVWDGFKAHTETNPAGSVQGLASNSVIVPQNAPLGATDYAMTLAVNQTSLSDLTIEALTDSDGGDVDPSINIAVLGQADADYAVPGNSYPSTNTMVSLSVTVQSSAPPGLRAIKVTSGSTPSAGSTISALIDIVRAD